MSELNQFQKTILNAIASEQEETVQIAMCQYKDGDDIENLLYNTTYELIAGIMTLIDGYTNDNIKLDIVDRLTGDRLKEKPFIELHDRIADFIKYEKPK
ncbi:hypothetical protein [Anaerocolumna jejuensis]|uniref:hypothetical protein n=1 Tax=Anaerocolumna jejuensis TaxID=259063 RepID=UPI003F7C1631